MKRLIYLMFLTIAILSSLTNIAQNVPSREERADTSKITGAYPYALPIMGNKIHKLGFRLPYPHGIMINALYGVQDIRLSDLYIGFGSGDPIRLDDIVAIEKSKAYGTTFNVRFDTWVLPFLNLYAIGGYGSTKINIKLSAPVELETKPDVSTHYYGGGALVAGAVGSIFFSVDANHLWNFNPNLNTPAKIFSSGLRVGPVFNFKNNPDMNVVLWAGTMFTHLGGHTVGIIPARDVFPGLGEKIDEIQQGLDEWFFALPPLQQELLRETYNKLTDGLTGIKEGIETENITYEMKKSVPHPFNMMVGAQWQINYRWQLRTEVSFLGSRTAGMLSLNYRFGIRGKNWLSNP